MSFLQKRPQTGGGKGFLGRNPANQSPQEPAPRTQAGGGKGLIGRNSANQSQQEPAPRPQTSVVDMQKKRRSGSCERSPLGKSFINTDPKPHQTNRIFFRTKTSRTIGIDAQQFILHQLGQLQPQQLISLAMLFSINPPLPESFILFVKTIAPNDTIKLNQVQHGIYTVLQPQLSPQTPQSPEVAFPSFPRNTPPSFGPIFSYDFSDARYLHCDEESLIMKEPLALGHRDIETEIKLPIVPPGYRITLQCFASGIANPPIQWPFSLRLFINGIPLKLDSFFSFPLIDLTKFAPQSVLKIQCGVDQKQRTFAFVLRCARYKTFKQIVLDLQNAPPSNTLMKYDTNNTVVICPISGRLMKYPGRGINCDHAQCFDLMNYIKTSNMMRRWICPICQKSTPLNQLYYSRVMSDLIYSARGAGHINEVASGFQPQNSTSFFDDGSTTIIEDDGISDTNFFNMPYEGFD